MQYLLVIINKMIYCQKSCKKSVNIWLTKPCLNIYVPFLFLPIAKPRKQNFGLNKRLLLGYYPYLPFILQRFLPQNRNRLLSKGLSISFPCIIDASPSIPFRISVYPVTRYTFLRIPSHGGQPFLGKRFLLPSV